MAWIKSEYGDFVNLGAALSLRIVDLSYGSGVDSGFAIEATFPAGHPARIVTCSKREIADLLLEVLLMNIGYLGEMSRTIPMTEDQHAEWLAAGKPVSMLREFLGLPIVGRDADMHVPGPADGNDGDGGDGLGDDLGEPVAGWKDDGFQ